MTDLKKINKALNVATYGSIDGAHHKMWVKNFENGEDGPSTFEWNKGVAP